MWLVFECSSPFNFSISSSVRSLNVLETYENRPEMIVDGTKNRQDLEWIRDYNAAKFLQWIADGRGIDIRLGAHGSNNGCECFK